MYIEYVQTIQQVVTRDIIPTTQIYYPNEEELG